jgi:AbrB family looped-hinge helix DNA binding protein
MKSMKGGRVMAGGKHILGKQNAQRVFGTAKVGDRGQIVIPKEARDFFGIEPGDTLLILGKTETGLIVTKPETLDDLASRIFKTVENED